MSAAVAGMVASVTAMTARVVLTSGGSGDVIREAVLDFFSSDCFAVISICCLVWLLFRLYKLFGGGGDE